jgi:hypothetical protein
MKYMTTVFDSHGESFTNVTTTGDDVDFVSFPATVNNPNYDQFLVSAKLTDKKVKALEPDVWFDFPEETN